MQRKYMQGMLSTANLKTTPLMEKMQGNIKNQIPSQKNTPGGIP
jgi:hypothetical protein